ncbi:Ulp1 family isopeptidase [Rickettsia oklahomensis]|uniref:Ulp1 family isopeptidase n=1 Tax=Rickettsia oklahomensis TaxID=3141789 RepID=A0AAU7BYR4_9RICK
MAEPIIFTLLLGNKDRILERINNQNPLNKLPIIPLQVNKEVHISDKERIFSEILEQSHKEGKIPIFNIQLNNNVRSIFQVQDLINAQNLNIKTTITFDQYNSLTQNPELKAYWKQIMEQVDHVFFVNEADQNLAINENIINKDKTTTIKDTNIDLTSVFNNLIYNQEIDQLLSETIPDKAKLDKIIKNTKNQGGRVIIEAWPISEDEAINLITAKFGITSEDQIYGLKLEINEILKDQNNAAENLKKYVSQISQQFQKDLGRSEINPIDFNFNIEKIIKNGPEYIKKEHLTSYQPPKENQTESQGLFRRIFNYFKDIVISILCKKEKPQTLVTSTLQQKLIVTQELQAVAPSIIQLEQQAAVSNTKTWAELGITQKVYEESLQAKKQFSTLVAEQKIQIPEKKSSPIINTEAQVGISNIENIKKPNYLYTEDDIKNILEANIDQNKFSIFHHASLEEPALLKDTFRAALEGLIVDNKKPIIPLNTGHNHWLFMMASKDDKGNITFIYNDPTGQPLETRPRVVEYINEVYSDVKIIDLKTKQQENAYDCGVFVCNSAINLSKGQNILTTLESKGQSINLRETQANTLLTQQQAKAIRQALKTNIGQQLSNKFHKMVSQKTNDQSRQL